jgi:hypothetical protein
MGGREGPLGLEAAPWLMVCGTSSPTSRLDFEEFGVSGAVGTVRSTGGLVVADGARDVLAEASFEGIVGDVCGVVGGGSVGWRSRHG